MIKKGFTLVEILISVTIFVVIISVSGTIFYDSIKAERRSSIENRVYSDAKIMMELLANIVHENTIDYDEYYSMNVIQEAQKDLDGGPPQKLYGLYHGVYGSRFYNPGQYHQNEFSAPQQGKNPDQLGSECSVPYVGPIYPNSYDEGPCQIIFTPSRDENTGENPFNDGNCESGSCPNEPQNASAFCDELLGQTCTGNNVFDELYLINSEGNQKTILARQIIKENEIPDPASPDHDTDYAIGTLKLNGIDSDDNGIIDLFTCDEKFDCGVGDSLTAAYNLEDNFPNIATILSNIKLTGENSKLAGPYGFDSTGESTNYTFIPMTPFRSSIRDLKFIVHPAETPYKAFSENDSQLFPYVTIVLTLEPSKIERDNYPGIYDRNRAITVQRTVTTGVHGDVETFPPTSDTVWMTDVLTPLTLPPAE
ncbi:prepilin-type N-terminal cleavage/methylation domain-containing protein [Patescibacteria group bacterium]|nr:prepilin-type N-terminal cleavage/methylation domain-containing protein [Patescibacteria group bacterium]